MAFENLKKFSEHLFDLLMHNLEDVEEAVFFDSFYVEWNGNDASIDIYENVDYPHEADPLYRFFCVDGSQKHPILVWLDWCNACPDPYKWMKDVWPNEKQYWKHIHEINELRSKYRPDEYMNRFLRQLPSCDQDKLLRYVMTTFTPAAE